MRATALLTPEAIPAWRGSAAARTVIVTGATTSVSPRPKTMIARQDGLDVAVADVDLAHHEHADRDHERSRRSAACRGPIRWASAPARGESSSMSAVVGSEAAPASIAV